MRSLSAAFAADPEDDDDYGVEESWHRHGQQVRRVRVMYGPTRSKTTVRLVAPDPPLQPDVSERFEELAEQWLADTVLTSSSHAIIMHPAYQSIIGLGMPAVPLILERLAQQSHQWFWALHHITGASPAPANSSPREAAAAWLRWAEWPAE